MACQIGINRWVGGSVNTHDLSDETLPQPFCEEIREFKVFSRSFHEWIANTEAVHNPRSLNRISDGKILEMMVGHACRKSYSSCGSSEGKHDDAMQSKRERFEVIRISNTIRRAHDIIAGTSEKLVLEIVYLTVLVHKSKEMSVVPLFKVYGNKRDQFLLVSRSCDFYYSLVSFLGQNDLPHCLVCAAREGSENTYEIDPVLNKYPIQFFTVNLPSSDRSIAYLKTFTTDGIPSFNWLKPKADVVWSLILLGLKQVRPEIKCYKDNNVNFESLVPKSKKNEFLEGLEKVRCLQPQFISLFNLLTSYAFAFCQNNEIQTFGDSKELYSSSLFLNGNIFTRFGSEFCNAFMSDRDGCLITPGMLPKLHRLSDVWKFFLELIRKFQEHGIQWRGLNNYWREIWELLNLIGNLVLQMFPVGLIRRVASLIRSATKLGICILSSWLTEERNYIEGKMTATEAKSILRENRDLSLGGFLEVYKKKDLDLSEALKEENVELALKNCASESGIHSPQIFPLLVDGNTSIFVTQDPISETIEKLLEDSNKSDATVYVRRNDIHEILSDETVWSIRTYKHDGTDSELQFIFMENKKNVLDGQL